MKKVIPLFQSIQVSIYLLYASIQLPANLHLLKIEFTKLIEF